VVRCGGRAAEDRGAVAARQGRVRRRPDEGDEARLRPDAAITDAPLLLPPWLPAIATAFIDAATHCDRVRVKNAKLISIHG
jgi:hypothetical protein